MNRLQASRRSHVITRKQAVFALNFVAGWVDAVGFLALVGSVRAFPSFMSGNSTKVVTDLVSGDPVSAAMIAGVVFAFILGTILTRLLNDGTRWRECAALMGVAALLWLAAAGVLWSWSEYVLLLLLAFSMGTINRALQGRNGFTVHTFVSGAVVTIGSDIADAISGRGEWKQTLLPLSIWAAILSGAAVGGVLTVHVGLAAALFMPGLVVGLLALINGGGWLEPAGQARDGHLDALEAHG